MVTLRDGKASLCRLERKKNGRQEKESRNNTNRREHNYIDRTIVLRFFRVLLQCFFALDTAINDKD